MNDDEIRVPWFVFVPCLVWFIGCAVASALVDESGSTGWSAILFAAAFPAGVVVMIAAVGSYNKQQRERDDLKSRVREAERSRLASEIAERLSCPSCGERMRTK